ncbi:uncharacterized protein LOC135485743 isoform X2 [Lineus longissimus]|uniref:uncharacterized protein LOC135485743 isoform X2 n=1 Tax=Lineus longissimus TaxID=88925 RepID=UPI00315C956B
MTSASTITSKVKRPRTIFTEEQQKELNEAIDSGLRKTVANASQIADLAAKCCLTVKQVEDYVINHTRDSNPQSTKRVNVKPRANTGLNGFQLFIKENNHSFPERDEPNSTKLKAWKQHWDALSQEERNDFNDKSKTLASEPLDNVQVHERKRYLVKSAILLMDSFQEVGMEGYLLLVDPMAKANEFNYFSGGTAVGKKFLDSTEGRAQSDFNLYVLKGVESAVPSTSASTSSTQCAAKVVPRQSNWLQNSVKAGMNELYASFVKKPEKAFAYAEFSRQKFAALGMPCDIVAKLRKSNNLSVLGNADLEKLDLLLKKGEIILVSSPSTSSSDPCPSSGNGQKEFVVNVEEGGRGNILVVPSRHENQDPFPTTTTSGSSSNGIQEFSGATPTCIVAGGESDSEGSISVEIVKPSKRNKKETNAKSVAKKRKVTVAKNSQVSNFAAKESKQVTIEESALPDGHFIVEKILKDRMKNGVRDGYDSTHNTWEPMKELPKDIVTDYYQNKKKH